MIHPTQGIRRIPRSRRSHRLSFRNILRPARSRTARGKGRSRGSHRRYWAALLRHMSIRLSRKSRSPSRGTCTLRRPGRNSGHRDDRRTDKPHRGTSRRERRALPRPRSARHPSRYPRWIHRARGAHRRPRCHRLGADLHGAGRFPSRRKPPSTQPKGHPDRYPSWLCLRISKDHPITSKVRLATPASWPTALRLSQRFTPRPRNLR